MATITDPTSANPFTTPSRSEASREELTGNFEDFLTLFIEQLKNQDPLSPMESTEFTDSLANLSAVEQSVNQNTNLERIIDLLQGETQTLGDPVSYLGKEIDYDSPAFQLVDSQASFNYSLEERPEEVVINIYDAAGKSVFNAKGSENIGRNNITWDGTDTAGNQLPDGSYVVAVEAVYGEDNVAELPVSSRGVVTEALFEKGEVVLMVDNIRIPQEKVLAVR